MLFLQLILLNSHEDMKLNISTERENFSYFFLKNILKKKQLDVN